MAILHGDIELRNDEIFGRNGDLAHGEVPEQHIGAIVNANTGNFRKWPTLGANLIFKLNAPLDSRAIAADIQNAVFLDGWRVDAINIATDGLDDIEITVAEATKTTDETKSLI